MERSQTPPSRFDSLHLDTGFSRSISPLPYIAAHVSSTDHSSTPPISVPLHGTGRQNYTYSSSYGNTGGSRASDGSTYMNSGMLSPIEAATRTRKSGIAFDSQVKIDGGRKLPLQSPLPRSSRAVNDYFFQTPTVLPEEDENFETRSTMVRSSSVQSLSDSSQLVPGRTSSRRERKRRPSAAARFLQSFHAPRAEEKEEQEEEKVASLTTNSTLSTPMSEFHTPPPANLLGGDFFTDAMTQSPLVDPLVVEESSPWSRPSIGRTKTSFPLESRASSRSRQTRRAFSERSSNPCSLGSNGVSPASVFLQGINTPRTTAATEPDSEGQEVGSYVLGKEIGFGGFSTIKEAITIEDDIEVTRAVKIVRKRVHDKDAENDQIQALFDAEVSLWRCLDHPNILPLLAVYDTPFATYAIMKLNRGGSLYDLLKKNRQGISARRAQHYGNQLACALRYLHEDMRIVHGDVKLENCLLDMSENGEDGGNLVLCDFGLAKFIRNPHDDDDSALPNTPGPAPSKGQDGIGGSLQYAAPEMLTATTPLSSPAADIWAYACVIYCLHTGVLPFQHSFQPKLQAMILQGAWDVEKLKTCWGLVEAGSVETDKVVEVITGGLEMSIERRWTVRDVLESTWLEGCGWESP